MGVDLHVHDPSPLNPVCDFCYGQDLAADYPVRDVETARLGVLSDKAGGFLSLNSLGWWCACRACHELIQAGDRDALALRATKHGPNGRMLAKLDERVAVGLIRHIHDQFWKSREGAPYRHDLSKVPYVKVGEAVSEAYCHACRVGMDEAERVLLHPNLSIHGPCSGCGRELGYTEEDRLA